MTQDIKGEQQLWCSACQQKHSTSEFSKNRSRSTGYALWCKKTFSKYQKERYGPEYHRKWNKALKEEVIAHYGSKCECCGEDEIDFLAIDHINGKGTSHRKEVGFGNHFFKWLRKNNWPDGFRVMCHNCNWSIHLNKGKCIHQIRREMLEPKKTLVFCYGTLKSGLIAHYLMGDSEFLGEAQTAPIYEIRHMRSFPGMVEENHSGSGVKGELYECSDAVMEALDRYECISHGLFRRTEIELEDGTKAHAYLYNRGYGILNPPVQSGIWTEEDAGIIA